MPCLYCQRSLTKERLQVASPLHMNHVQALVAVVIVAVALTVGAVAGAAEMVSTALVHSISCRTIRPPCGCQAACFACPLIWTAATKSSKMTLAHVWRHKGCTQPWA